MQILHGDCLELLPTLQANSIDAIVTDPPYHLLQNSRNGSAQPGDLSSPYGRHGPSKARGFMNTEWDGGDIAFRPDVWRECLRVLKPGGHLAAFGGSRTHHRLWCAIEDAGFEVRDTCMWLHGQGFPKSHDVSKGIDKAAGAVREVIGQHERSDLRKNGAGFRNLEGLTEGRGAIPITAPATPEAAAWQGWGTALKPAHEPILLARKPLIGTVAQNVLRNGTGGINVDACRVPTSEPLVRPSIERHDNTVLKAGLGIGVQTEPPGRWPANVCTDGSEEVVECFPHSTDGVAVAGKGRSASIYGTKTGGHKHEDQGYGGRGSAARFFPALGFSDDERRVMYSPKASKRDRAGSKHPTVKPQSLMRWLCKLICPPGGVILDPFAGSGSTGQAAVNLGFDCILIEREDAYIRDIHKRFEA